MSERLAVANFIGARLCREAIWSRRTCGWMGWVMEPGGATGWRTVYRALGSDVYSGTAGIAWFLAQLYGETPVPMYARVAVGALGPALESVEGARDASVYSGALGVAWAAWDSASRIGAQALSERAFELLRSVAMAPARGSGLDVIAGSAGAIPVFLGLAERTGDGLFTEAAVAHGDELLARSRSRPAGRSWDTMPGLTHADPTGFAHGVAGMHRALVELAAATGEPRFGTAADEALAYEQSCYDAEACNWPDFRAPAGGPRAFGTAWCHGGPGIALARLAALRVVNDDEVAKQARAGLESCRAMLGAARHGVDLTYCHGAIGAAEPMLMAALAFGDPTLSEPVDALADFMHERHVVGEEPWPCGVPGAGETPGLMLGFAGIGHFFLRLHAPDRTPSALLVS